VEAVLGAACLDQGYDAVRRLIQSWLGQALDEVASRAPEQSAKTTLQELLQARGSPPPDYRVVTEQGPDHDKLFVVQIQVGDEPVAEGRGRSKKEAETAAAQSALEELEER
jgi:ribonuclease-3